MALAFAALAYSFNIFTSNSVLGSNSAASSISSIASSLSSSLIVILSAPILVETPSTSYSASAEAASASISFQISDPVAKNLDSWW